MLNNQRRITCNLSYILYCKLRLGEFCGDTVYDPATHVCCCGQAHEKENGYECCSNNYFDPSVKLCCQGGELVDQRGHCPVLNLNIHYIFYILSCTASHIPIYNPNMSPRGRVQPRGVSLTLHPSLLLNNLNFPNVNTIF